MKTDIKLVVDIDAGEGAIRIMPHFEKMSVTFQLDVLGDWIHDLQELYNGKVDDWERELSTFEGTRGEEMYPGKQFRVKPEASIRVGISKFTLR